MAGQLTDTLRRYLGAAEELERSGLDVTDQAVALWLGVTRPGVARARQALQELGLWRWKSGREALAERQRRRHQRAVAEAAARLVSSGQAVTKAALVRETGFRFKVVFRAIKALVEHKEFPWRLEDGRTARPEDDDLGPRPGDPTPEEIAERCVEVQKGWPRERFLGLPCRGCPAGRWVNPVGARSASCGSV